MRLRRFARLGCGLAAIVLPAACAAPPPPPVFDPAEASLVLRGGDNVIVGRAAFYTYGGVYASCAGGQATLLPDTPYTRWRLDRLYGGGYPRAADIADAPRIPPAPDYLSYLRHARCSPTGAFEFNNLADGRYIVVAALDAPGVALSVRRDVAVYGGIGRSLVLTP